MVILLLLSEVLTERNPQVIAMRGFPMASASEVRIARITIMKRNEVPRKDRERRKEEEEGRAEINEEAVTDLNPERVIDLRGQVVSVAGSPPEDQRDHH